MKVYGLYTGDVWEGGNTIRIFTTQPAAQNAMIQLLRDDFELENSPLSFDEAVKLNLEKWEIDSFPDRVETFRKLWESRAKENFKRRPRVELNYATDGCRQWAINEFEIEN